MGNTTKEFIVYATTAEIADALNADASLDELSFKGIPHTKAILTAAKMVHHSNNITDDILELIIRNDKGECNCCGLSTQEDHVAIKKLAKLVKPVKELSNRRRMMNPFAMDDLLDKYADSIPKYFSHLFEKDGITPITTTHAS